MELFMDRHSTTIQAVCDSSKNASEAMERIASFLRASPNPDERVKGVLYDVATLGGMASVPDGARPEMLMEVGQLLPQAFGMFFKVRLKEIEWTDDGDPRQDLDLIGVELQLTPPLPPRPRR
jgi:hypothetical protein